MIKITLFTLYLFLIVNVELSSNAVFSHGKCSSNYEDRYIFHQTPMTWDNARSFCRGSNRTDLAVINSDEEFNYLKTVTTGSYWVGLSDQAAEGTYTWTDSIQSEEYSPAWLWNRDEPNDAGHCALLQKKTFVHGLSDVDCNYYQYFICEDDHHTCTPEMYFSSNPCDMSGRYKLTFSPKTWWDAKDYCELFGRQLVSLDTEYDVRYVRQKLIERTDGSQNYLYWVGLNENSMNGVWRWAGHDEYGEVPTLMDGRRWNRAEPNGGFVENCIQIANDLFGNRGFNDMDCNGEFPFICEVTQCQSGHFTSYHGYRLFTYVLYSLQVSRFSKCIAACLEDESCQSVNFIPSSNGLCEINAIAGGPGEGENYAGEVGSVHAVQEEFIAVR